MAVPLSVDNDFHSFRIMSFDDVLFQWRTVPAWVLYGMHPLRTQSNIELVLIAWPVLPRIIYRRLH